MKKRITLLRKPEIEKLVATEANTTIAVAKDVIKAYEHVVREALLNGYGVTVGGVGMLRHSYCAAREAREWFNPAIKKNITVKATAEYNRPSFRPNPHLVREMREKTWGETYEGE